MNFRVSRESLTKVSAMFRSIVAALAFLALLPVAAAAVTPRPKAMLEAHEHNTSGSDWHVQLEVNKRATGLATVVVYSQKCKATGFITGARLGADGTFDLVDVPLKQTTGNWSVKGIFSFRDRANGTWSLTSGECSDSGEFQAQDASGHFLVGNPYEYAPASINGDSLNARRLRRIKYLSRQNAPRFNTIAKSRKAGYVLSTDTGCPGMHHSRKHGTAMWGETLDPTAPQALMYWCDADRNWTLAGFMFRADGKTRPNTYGRMMQWHRHGATSHWMSHVWLVSDATAAFATCAPFRAFESAGMFEYVPYQIDVRADAPCSDSAPAEQINSQESAEQAP